MAARPDQRRRDLARIHLLAKQLGMDDEQYRAVLWMVGLVDSAAKLDAHGRQAVIRHLQSRLPDADRRPAVPPDRAPLLGKARALAGQRGDRYLMGVLRQMFGRGAPARIEWAAPQQLHKLVAALEYDRRRHAARKPEGAA